MHTHASDRKLTEAGSAKLFVKSNGDTVIARKGKVNDRELLTIQKFVKENYITMFEKWSYFSKNGFYGK